MLLRGPRLEGDCFPSDKNHLAPSEEPAQDSAAQNRKDTSNEWLGTALARPECTQAAKEDKPHMGLKQYQGSAA